MNDYEMINKIKKAVRHELSKVNYERYIKNELSKIGIESIIRKIVQEEVKKIFTNKKEENLTGNEIKNEEDINNLE